MKESTKEYLVLSSYGINLEETLNRSFEDGWEYVNSVVVGDHFYLVFRRINEESNN